MTEIGKNAYPYVTLLDPTMGKPADLDALKAYGTLWTPIKAHLHPFDGEPVFYRARRVDTTLGGVLSTVVGIDYSRIYLDSGRVLPGGGGIVEAPVENPTDRLPDGIDLGDTIAAILSLHQRVWPELANQ